MTGRLLRQAAAQEAFAPCGCGHTVHQHHERGRVLVFECDACECASYRRPIADRLAAGEVLGR